jgi:hypothetical protein
MESFINYLKDDDKKILVIIFPFIHLLGDNYPAQNVHIQLKDFFEKNNVETIDLLEELNGSDPKELIAGKFDSHPNEKVHKKSAELLFEKLEMLIN